MELKPSILRREGRDAGGGTVRIPAEDGGRHICGNQEGQICSWNQAAERLFGYSSADVLNRACCEVLDGHA
jgi:PAS domain-containing protein